MKSKLVLEKTWLKTFRTARSGKELQRKLQLKKILQRLSLNKTAAKDSFQFNAEGIY